MERDRHVEPRQTSEVMSRGRQGSYRFNRAQSMIPQRSDRESMYMKRIANEATRYHDNAMTLPASYGRNKLRKNGEY